MASGLGVFVMAFVMAGFFYNDSAYAAMQGDGSENNPYQISTCAELYQMNNDLDAHYVMTASVDCSHDLTVITGTSAAPFAGTFNGNGFTIANITYADGANDRGVFGYTSGAKITNVDLDNITMNGAGNVGALVGFTYQTTISYVSVTNSNVWGTGQYTGGIVGYLGGSTVMRSSVASTTVEGDAYVGGVAGVAIGPTTIYDSYFQGTINGSSLTGGITGQAGAGPAIVANTYADATFSNAGSGVVGQTAFGATVSNSFIASAPYLGNSTQSPLDTWDFSGIWQVRAGQYPGLRSYPVRQCLAPIVTDNSAQAQCDTVLPMTGTTTWNLQYSIASTSSWLPLPDQTGAGFDVTVAGLLPGTGYEVRFRFDNSDIGKSTWAKVEATTTGNSDVDGDGTVNKDEALGPNAGDADNDGTQDYLQANVTSFKSFISGNYIVLKHSCTDNFNVQLGMESSTDADSTYDYPVGLLGFVARGCSVGVSVPIQIFYYGSYQPGAYIARKSQGSNYTTIPGAVLSSLTIGGQPVLRLAYSVTDGSSLDSDGIADGNIVDPVGLGSSTVIAPDTGSQPWSLAIPIAVLIAGVTLLAAATLQLRQKR